MKAPFAASLRTGRGTGILCALPLAGLLVAGAASAQQPQPPFGPAPGAQPAPQPQPGFGAQPQPQPGFGAQPAPQPQPGAGAQGNFTFGGGAGAQGGLAIEGGAAAAPAPAEDEAAERELSLIEQNNATGSTGLLRTSYAGSGAAGTFRVSFLSDWFSTTGFLCRPDKTTAGGQSMGCSSANAEDKASHVGGFFALNATPLSWLEGYLQLRTYANSNDQGRPQLLQVLGDTTLGAKAFLPPKLGRVFTYGGEVQLFLLNGTGGVGPMGGSTSAAFRLLGSADLRKPGGQGVPLRFNLNLGYKLDNSGKLVADIETARAASFKDGRETTPISRIERYGLGINRVDSFQVYLGAMAPFGKVQPFLEYTMDVPINRQGYQCHTGRTSQGDVCLGLADFKAADPTTAGGPGFSAVPSRFTLGVRTTPFEGGFRGLSATLALDLGVTGKSTFVEEVAPQAPWTLYFGLGYAYDTRDKAAPPPPPAPPAPPRIVQAPQNYVRGYVHDAARVDLAVPSAIISLEGVASQPPVATGADGRFLTRDLPAGTYTFTIKAPGFKPGQCIAAVGLAAAPAAPQGQPWSAQPGQPWQPGQPQPFGGQPQPGQPQPFGQQPGGPAAPPPPAMPSGPVYVDIDCSLESLPKLGTVVGVVKDEKGASVPGAVIRATDSASKPFSATADGSGAFQLKDIAPGAINVRADKDGYLSHGETLNASAGQDTRATIVITKRPKNANVKVEGKEIRITQQVHFETDSAKIMGDSNALIEEVADVLQRTPSVKKVEIQGHTDNAGSREHNQQLSDARAASVRQALINAGVDGGRLVSKGYGQDRPVAPNVTAANRARNRRVQLIILEKQ